MATGSGGRYHNGGNGGASAARAVRVTTRATFYGREVTTYNANGGVIAQGYGEVLQQQANQAAKENKT